MDEAFRRQRVLHSSEAAVKQHAVLGSHAEKSHSPRIGAVHSQLEESAAWQEASHWVAAEQSEQASPPRDLFSPDLPQHLLVGFSQEEVAIISGIVAQVLAGEIPKTAIAEVWSIALVCPLTSIVRVRESKPLTSTGRQAREC